MYDVDISPAFPGQLLSFRLSFGSQLSVKSTTFEIAQLLLFDYHALSIIYRHIQWCLYCLQAAAAADTASDCCDMWAIIFKTLKIRNAMFAERPGNVENERAKNLEISKMHVVYFAQEKARKQTF